MKIYDRSGFPNPARIRIVLAEKDLDARIEFISVDLIAAEHKQPPFLAKSRSGVLPILELDDGTIISESTAITEFLDNLEGHPTLTGTTPRDKAIIHMMQRRAEVELIDAVGIYFHHATPGLGPLLQVHKAPDWAKRAAWGNMHREKAVVGMRYFDDVLRASPYVAGATFSMPDITVFCGLMFADAAGISIADDLTALHAWRSRVSKRPAVRNRSGQNFLPEDAKRLGL